MRQTVQMRSAYAWTCECCGRTWTYQHEGFPEKVCCVACGAVYFAVGSIEIPWKKFVDVLDRWFKRLLRFLRSR